MPLSQCYPISLKLENRICLVVGGGPVAERKVHSLLERSALLRLVSPRITPGIRELAKAGKIDFIQDIYRKEYLKGIFLVVGATNCEKTNHQVSADCLDLGLLINVVDDPSRCNFYVPAVVKRGSLQVAISTDGKSPLLARKIREQLEEHFPAEYEDLVDFLGELREAVISEAQDPIQKGNRIHSLLDRETMTLVSQGKFDLAKERIKNAYLGGWSQP